MDANLLRTIPRKDFLPTLPNEIFYCFFGACWLSSVAKQEVQLLLFEGLALVGCPNFPNPPRPLALWVPFNLLFHFGHSRLFKADRLTSATFEKVKNEILKKKSRQNEIRYFPLTNITYQRSKNTHGIQRFNACIEIDNF